MTRIEGIIRTVTPLHIAAPDNGSRFDFKTGKVSFAKTDPPLTRIRTVRVHSKGIAERYASYVSDGAAPRDYIDLPEIPSNLLRGGFRRAAAAVILKHIAAQQATVSLDAYHTLQCGASIGSPAKKELPVRKMRQAMDHPYFGLYGGTVNMVRSSLQVRPGYPLVPAVVEDAKLLHVSQLPHWRNVMSDSDRISSVVMNLRDDETVREIPAQFAAVNPKAIEEIEAWTAYVNKESDKRDKQRNQEEGAGDEKVSKTSLRSFTAREHVDPGVNFSLINVINSFDEVHIGLHFMTLQEYGRKNVIGGRSAIGYGAFRFENVVVYHDGGQCPLFQDDSVTYEFSDAPYVQSCVAAAREWLATIDVNEMEEWSARSADDQENPTGAEDGEVAQPAAEQKKPGKAAKTDEVAAAPKKRGPKPKGQKG